MPARINLNIESLTAQRNMSITNSKFKQSVERISSGLRISRAADDAAGLTISEKLRAQHRGLDMAVRNSQDAISLLQTSEGALNEVHAILQRMRELAIQATNDTYNPIDRSSIQAEMTQLKTEIDRISNVTQFNHKSLLNGDQVFNFHIGANTDTANETLTLAAMSSTTAVIGSATLAGPKNLHLAVTGISVGGAGATAALTAHANGPRESFLSLVSSVDDAIEDINGKRALLGAYQNRLEHTIQSLQVQSENTKASESRIRDSDIAAEMSTFVKNQILQQSAIAIIAQANQVPTLVLQLLR